MLSLRLRLQKSLGTAAPAGRAIASYMLANLQAVPFETSKSLAAKVGVSELTVGRFCRALGYRHFKDLKESLKPEPEGTPWLESGSLAVLPGRDRAAGPDLARSLEREVAALVKIYDLARSPAWSSLVERLSQAEAVHIAGFQTERGVAAILAHQLQYVRDGVHLVDLSGGSFAGILLGRAASKALVIIETRRYSRQAELLARRAKQAGIPVTLITDPYCDWGDNCADEVFKIPTNLDFFWDSSGPLVSFANLLVNAVFARLGPEVQVRLKEFSGLYREFVGYIGPSPDENPG